MEVRRHPLRELQQLRATEYLLQLRLADEDNLQELLLIRVDMDSIRSSSSASTHKFWASSTIKIVLRPLEY